MIVGLGESQFQIGQKNEARATWAALRERVRPPVRGHLRLAEVLLEHDLAPDAIVEADRAQALEPRNVDPHRLLAQIFEHQKKVSEAVAEWNAVLASPTQMPGNEQHAALRREARVRLLGLLMRQGRGRMDAQIRQLRDDARAHPDDLEMALFLAGSATANRRLRRRNRDPEGSLTRVRTGEPTGIARDVAVEARSRSFACSSAAASWMKRWPGSTTLRGSRQRHARARRTCRSRTSRWRATT